MFNNLSLHSFTSLAREKMHGAASHGAKDDVRLCRWVLLKNSLTNALSRSTETTTTTTAFTTVASYPTSPATTTTTTTTEPVDETDSFLFPDGDVFADTFVNAEEVKCTFFRDNDLGSEAQWLDSLLESLGDEESEVDALVTVVPVDGDEEEDEDSELMSLFDSPSSEDLSCSASSSSSSPESILLPPSPPLRPYSFDSAPPPLRVTTLFRYGPITAPASSYGAPQTLPHNITYSSSDLNLNDDTDPLTTLPDVIEDSSSDTDSESLNTPFTQSTSSLADAAATTIGGMVSPTAHHHHNSRLQDPLGGATPRAPFVRIVSGDDDVPPLNLIPYPHEFYAAIPESFEQEC